MAIAKRQPFALIVDDEPIQRQLVVAVLKKFGIGSKAVSTSKEFIALMTTSRPDFCLIDLHIEKLGEGFRLIEAIRKTLGTGPNLIVVSGDTDRNAVAHALELGANDFLIKPLDRNVLISKISHYVETEALLEARIPLLPVPDNGAPTTVDLGLAAQGVDEFGIKLIGPHLVSKGIVLRAGGDFIQRLTMRTKHVLLTVTSTWAEKDGSYGAFAEFDITDAELTTSVRQWLANQAQG